MHALAPLAPLKEGQCYPINPITHFVVPTPSAIQHRQKAFRFARRPASLPPILAPKSSTGIGGEQQKITSLFKFSVFIFCLNGKTWQRPENIEQCPSPSIPLPYRSQGQKQFDTVVQGETVRRALRAVCLHLPPNDHRPHQALTFPTISRNPPAVPSHQLSVPHSVEHCYRRRKYLPREMMLLHRTTKGSWNRKSCNGRRKE